MNKNPQINFGKNIQILRHVLGMKQEAVAYKLKINQQTLSLIEKQVTIENTLLKKIADTLGVSVQIIKNISEGEIVHQINKNTFNDNTGIGKKIEGVRRFLGITQPELGKALGITKQAVSKMERVKKISSNRIFKVANALGVNETGLRNFNEEAIQYSLYKSILSKNDVPGFEISNIARLEKAIKFLQYLLKKEKLKLKE